MSIIFKWVIPLGLLGGGLLISFAAMANEQFEKCEVRSSIQAIVQKLNSAPEGQERIKRAKELPLFIEQINPEDLKCIDEETIASIAKILEDKDQAVQRSAVISLGAMGTIAKSALPALEKTLKRVESPEEAKMPRTGLSYPIDIRIAISRIQRGH